MIKYLAIGLVALLVLASPAVASYLPTPKAPSVITSNLPSCTAALAGTHYLVTDALTPIALSTLTGGGAVVVPVVCNGTAWIVG